MQDYVENGEYKDFGAGWMHSDGTSITGKIYQRPFVAVETIPESERAPLYRLEHPTLRTELGALWEKTSKKGDVYLSGKFGPTKETQRWVALWPREQRSERSPVLGVLPPSDREEFDRDAWDAAWAALDAQMPKPESGNLPAWRKQPAPAGGGQSAPIYSNDDIPF